MKGKIRDVFPGGNTSKGFYSFYRYILSQEEARRIICIKGGPGTGKSSLMKSVAAYFNDKGYDVELHHCSSDNNSLDGVVIKDINVALLDGTAPHVVDPVNPGAVDEILNMGQCWNEEGFKNHRRTIIDINKEVGKTFRRAYRYLGAAKMVHDDWSNFNNEALNISKLNALKEDLKEKILGKSPITRQGFDRHLFATAFTPNGIITFVDTLYKDYKNIYVLNGGPGTGKSEIMNYISKGALKRGFYVEVFHDPFIPERIEHILIPDLSVAILSSNEINQRSFEGIQISTEDCLNPNVINKYRDEIEVCKDYFYKLISKALTLIASAKSLHDEMEKSYIPNMDFARLDSVKEDIIKKLEIYEKEYLESK